MEDLKMKLFKMLVLTSLFSAATMKAAEIDFNNVSPGSDVEVKGLGKVEVVKVSEGDNAMRVKAKDSKSPKRATVNLHQYIGSSKKFNISFDVRTNNTYAAGSPVGLAFFNPNKSAFSIVSPPGSGKLYAMDYSKSKAVKKTVCEMKSNKWYNFSMNIDKTKNLIEIEVKEKSSNLSVFSGKFTTNKDNEIFMLVIDTWPGQGMYYYDIDNLKINLIKGEEEKGK